jgi:hypothetical protein
MTWEQKIQAMQAIGDFSLRMRHPGNWYIGHSVSRKEGNLLSGGLISAKTPADAVEEYWLWLTDPKHYIVLREAGARRAVRWNGFMWQDVVEEKEPTQ